MKIVLLKEVQNLGHAGDIKDVSEGYARNFLIPRGLADISSKHSLSILEAQKNKRDRLALKSIEDMQKLAKKINNKQFEIKAKSDEKGTLYSKITTKIIASELKKQGFNIKDKEIFLSKEIKKIGEHKLILDLMGKKINIKIFIIS